MIQRTTSMATQMQQEMIQAEAGAKLSRLVLDSAKAQGDALVEMINMQKEIHAHLGGSVNTWA